MEKNVPLNFVVLGGSETAGVDCNDGKKQGQQCSWSYRVYKWMKENSDNNDIVYRNLARGGTTSISILPVVKFMLEEIPVSDDKNTIIFIDYGVNDAFETANSFKELGFNVQEGISLSLEKIVNTIHELSNKAAIIGFNVPLLDKDQLLTTTRAYESVYNYYGIPSFRMDLMRWNGNEFWHWHSHTHPDFDGHILFANAITFTFSDYFIKTHPMVRDPAKLSKLPTCSLDSATYYSAFKDELNSNATCKHYEDRPGKPGFICEGEQEMTFKIHFGDEPRLMVTYLQSYKSIGDALLTINGVTVTLMGKRDEKVSQTRTTYFHADDKRNQANYGMLGLQGFGVPKNSDHVAHIKSKNGDKIKIISIVSC
jgi:hypothetical protein